MQSSCYCSLFRRLYSLTLFLDPDRASQKQGKQKRRVVLLILCPHSLDGLPLVLAGRSICGGLLPPSPSHSDHHQLRLHHFRLENATDDHGVFVYQKAKSRPATLFLPVCPMTSPECQRSQRHRMSLSNHHALADHILLRFALLRLNCA